MGAGKSTVAPVVARMLDRGSVDTDTLVAAAGGRAVDDWVARDPEGFRRAEAAVVRGLAGDDLVVACGGGVVLDPESVAEMRRTGVVVWIDVPVPVLADRLGTGAGRPLLRGDPAVALADIAGERREAYRHAAHITVDGTLPPGGVAEQVVAAWSRT